MCESLFCGKKKTQPSRDKRVAHFGKFVVRETNNQKPITSQLPSSRTNITEWKPFLPIRILVICFSSLQINHRINFCKHLQRNENRRCFWYVVMLCKFTSITGMCISVRAPETDFPFVCYNCRTHQLRFHQTFCPRENDTLPMGSLCFACDLYSHSGTAHGKSLWIHQKEQKNYP